MLTVSAKVSTRYRHRSTVCEVKSVMMIYMLLCRRVSVSSGYISRSRYIRVTFA